MAIASKQVNELIHETAKRTGVALKDLTGTYSTWSIGRLVAPKPFMMQVLQRIVICTYVAV